MAQAATVHLLLEAFEQLNKGLSAHGATPGIVGRALPPHIGGEDCVHQLIVVVVVAHPGVAVLQVFDGLNIHQSLDFLLNVHTFTSMIFFPHRGGKQCFLSVLLIRVLLSIHHLMGGFDDKVGRHADHHEDDAADHDVHAGTATEEIAHHRHNVAAQEDAGALNARQK